MEYSCENAPDSMRSKSLFSEQADKLLNNYTSFSIFWIRFAQTAPFFPEMQKTDNECSLPVAERERFQDGERLQASSRVSGIGINTLRQNQLFCTSKPMVPPYFSAVRRMLFMPKP